MTTLIKNLLDVEEDALLDLSELRQTRGVRTALLDRGQVEEDTRALTFVASTSGTKRDGIDLDLAGLDTTAFETNPVFLWAHDYSGRTLPIGKVVKIRKLKNRMDVTVEFDQEDDFARQVEQKYRDGFLNAVSIGWNIIEWRRGVESDGESVDDFIVTHSDLLDVSAVPVPGDPSALIKTQRDFLNDLGTKLLEVVQIEPVDGTRDVVDAGDETVEPTLDDALLRIDAAVEAVDAATRAVDESAEAITELVGLFREIGGMLDTQPVIDDSVSVDSLMRVRDALTKETPNAGQ